MSSSSPAVPPSARLRSLDALRGFDMFWIIGAASLVRGLQGLGDNSVTAAIARQLTHVDWEGLHFYDVIYPLFLFIIGVSLVFSMDRIVAEHGIGGALLRILRRGLLLYIFNIIYNGGLTARWPDIRLSGVLGMITFCYMGAAFLYVLLRGRIRLLICSALALLLGMWAAMQFVPIPDLLLEKASVNAIAKKIGSSDPAAISAAVPAHISGSYIEGKNLGNFIDFRFLPGKKSTPFYDNQGLTSPLTAVTICLLGVFAGRWLRDSKLKESRRGLVLLLAGIALVAVGFLWSLELPIVKKLWTSSFCVITGGLSAIALAVFYLIIDVAKWDRWCEPFVWIGSNSITIYMGAALIPFERIARRLVGGDIEFVLNTYIAKGLGGLVVAATSLGLAVALTWFLYKRRIFLRV